MVGSTGVAGYSHEGDWELERASWSWASRIWALSKSSLGEVEELVERSGKAEWRVLPPSHRVVDF